MNPIHVFLLVVRALLRDRTESAAENLALRQQLAVLEHQTKRPKLKRRDRFFLVWLSRLWPGWRSVLVVVEPNTVVRWHQLGFRLYWRWCSNCARARVESGER